MDIDYPLVTLCNLRILFSLLLHEFLEERILLRITFPHEHRLVLLIQQTMAGCADAPKLSGLLVMIHGDRKSVV